MTRGIYWKMSYSKSPVRNDMTLCVYITIAIAIDRFILVRSLSLYLRECKRLWNWVMANAKHNFVHRSKILFVFSSDVCSAVVFTSSSISFFFSFLFKWLEKRSNLNIMFVLTTPQLKDTASNSTSITRSFNSNTSFWCLRLSEVWLFSFTQFKWWNSNENTYRH